MLGTCSAVNKLIEVDYAGRQPVAVMEIAGRVTQYPLARLRDDHPLRTQLPDDAWERIQSARRQYLAGAFTELPAVILEPW